MPGVSEVLVVVDVQNGFFRAESAHVVPVIVDLVAKWQETGRDVIFTRYFNYPGSLFERLIDWTEMQGAPETDLVQELLPLAARGIVFDKRTYSMLNPEGIELVQSRGWTDIYVCGIATESCVLKTAVDAFEVGLTPWLIEDASASHAGPVEHEAGLLVTRRFIGEGQIISTAEALARIKAAPQTVP
jgi:nicotinamidase-related amidase